MPCTIGRKKDKKKIPNPHEPPEEWRRTFAVFALLSTLVRRVRSSTPCLRLYLCVKLVHLFGALRAVTCYMNYSLWQFLLSLAGAYLTLSPRNLCLSCLKRDHMSSNNSSRLCMTIYDDDMLHPEARKFCDCVLMTNSKSWCSAVQ